MGKGIFRRLKVPFKITLISNHGLADRTSKTCLTSYDIANVLLASRKRFLATQRCFLTNIGNLRSDIFYVTEKWVVISFLSNKTDMNLSSCSIYNTNRY